MQGDRISSSSIFRTALIDGRCPGSASVHIAAMSRMASTASTSTSPHLSSMMSSSRCSPVRVFSCKNGVGRILGAQMAFWSLPTTTSKQQSRSSTYPANNVQSLLDEACIGWPLSSHQLQQKHSKAIHI
jgi:hypothetical protein